MASSGLFLCLLLGIGKALTLSSDLKTNFDINGGMLPSDQYCSIRSVEKIVDSRFKSLATDFQDQIDNLKGMIEAKNSAETGVVEGKHHHEIQKRQTKAGKSTNPVCENSSSLCTFFYPDHPDSGLKKGNYSPTVTNEMMQDPSKVKGMPTNCKDLQLLGHKLNGLYLVKTSRPSQPTKIETVFCNFQSPTTVGDSQVFIGNVAVKTKSVHFYVQRNASFSLKHSVIPFDLARVNEGGAMDLGSGVFTAPVPGVYHFQFSGQKEAVPDFSINLQVNGFNVGVAYSYHNQPAPAGWDTISFSVSLRLKASDRVNLYFNGQGTLYDRYGGYFTHFSGWLAEEDLI